MAGGGRSAHSLIGLILEKENVLTVAQVHGILGQQRALRAQGKVVAFGQIALDMRLVTPPQLHRALKLQAKLAVPPGAPKPLGFYLIEAGLVSPSQLQRGLEVQAEAGGRLGEVLVAQGWLAPEMLEMFLAMQRKDREASPASAQP